jgi:glycosyltransferase involved in cell wall biosynthesis
MPASGEGSERPLVIAVLGDPNSVHVRRWIARLAHDHQVTMLVMEGQTVEGDFPAGVNVASYTSYDRHPPLIRGVVEARRSLRHVLGRLQPDILHAHYLTVYGWHARLAGFHPFAVTVWGSDVLITARVELNARLYARLTLASADLVMGDSAELVQASIDLGARAGRTHLVQFGVDTDRFAPGPDPGPLRERLGLVGRRVIFSPRTIAPLYRQTIAVAALAELAPDVVLLMSRHLAQANEIAAVERTAAELRIGDRVIIVPAIDHREMPDYYRLADAVLSIPISDGTPVTLLETLATGRPVVATDLPSVREWLADLDPEAMVPVDDAARAAAALKRLLASAPERLAETGRRGRALVEARADERTSLAATVDLYRDMVRR